MRNIQEIWLKIKALAEYGAGEWGLFAIVILVALSSFGLGRFSALVDARPLISVVEAEMSASAGLLNAGGMYVASKTGATYYFPWCSGATRIAATNQRWFVTEEAAKKAGYRPAKNCKGLGQ